MSSYNSISKFLDKNGNNVNILEEEIDLSVQQNYVELIQKLSKNPANLSALSVEYLENINNLFNSEVSEETKRQMLVVLATIDKVEVYRSIESYQKTCEESMKAWATIAMQQSRMLIQSSLMDDESEVYISTGLGGHGGKLRYFCVFINVYGVFNDFHRDILQKETRLAIEKADGEIEQFNFQDKYAELSVLLPLDIDLKDIFHGIVNECNLYGEFLKKDVIVTNVKRLTEKDIVKLLKTRPKED